MKARRGGHAVLHPSADTSERGAPLSITAPRSKPDVGQAAARGPPASFMTSRTKAASRPPRERGAFLPGPCLTHPGDGTSRRL